MAKDRRNSLTVVDDSTMDDSNIIESEAFEENPMLDVIPQEITDVPLETLENAPGYVFIPAAGIGALDLKEIILSYLLSLTNTTINVEKGALRTIQLPAHRYSDLSDHARKFMHAVSPTLSNSPAETK